MACKLIQPALLVDEGRQQCLRHSGLLVRRSDDRRNRGFVTSSKKILTCTLCICGSPLEVIDEVLVALPEQIERLGVYLSLIIVTAYQLYT